MSLKYGILGILNYSSRTGYEIDKIYKGSLNFFWQAQTSQIYRELNNMERQGWLTHSIENQTDRPNKKIYNLTSEGRQELNHWLLKTDMKEYMAIKFSFLVKLFFSAEIPINENIDVIKNFKEECNKTLELLLGYDNSSQGMDTFYWGMTVDFGRQYYKMCIEWADNSIEKLERREKE
jgi:DNA-binding PadR family transcriptional regulator